MADDDEYAGDVGAGEQPATPRPPQEELEERVESAEERIQEVEGEEEEGAGVLTRDQLVHDAAIAARQHYGKPKDEYVGEEGWFDLVDLWLMLPHILESAYHERFRRYASVLGWESRGNLYMIPQKYLIAMEGVDMALERGYIHPYFSDRWRYILFVKVLRAPFIVGVGPPLAWYDVVGPSKEEAGTWAEIVESGMPREEVRHQALRQDIENLRRKTRRYREMAQDVKEKIENDEYDSRRERQALQKQLQEYAMRLQEAKDDLEDAVERSKERAEQ